MDARANVKIRRPRLRDVPALRGFLRLCWVATYSSMPNAEAIRSLDRFTYLAVLRTIWSNSERHGLGTKFIAVDGDEIIGFVQASEHPRDELSLWGLYVHPDRQRRGIGTALLQAVDDAYPKARKMRVEVIASNQPAIAWYTRNGFSTYWSLPHGLFGEAVAVELMERKIER